MKFEKLRLAGFKSFVETTDFLIEDGLTGVVGPNGCGKSNLVEALRWVMGESSFKNMRASGMDDVIFSGSANRPERNMAEVSLTLNNESRSAPAAFNDSDELQVTRRIEREAGSNYKINGKDARAKDVQLLFADASTGARSPSMVGQGRIGELIAAKPTARRLLLEEAAGISGLHTRRHEAELRLRAAETNLERLEDVLGQLAQQLESLKRQARQAARYGALSDDIRTNEAILFHLIWTAAKKAQAIAESELNQAMSLVSEKAQESSQASKEQAILASKLPEFRHGEVEAAAALQRLNIAREQIEGELTRLSTAKQELEARVSQLLADAEREQRLAQENKINLEKLNEEGKALSQQLEGRDERQRALDEAFADAQEIAKDSETKLSEVTRDLAEKRARKAQAQQRAEELIQTVGRLEKERALARQTLDELVSEIAQLPDVGKFVQQKEELIAALNSMEAKAVQAEGDVENAREQQKVAQQKVQDARSSLQAIETEARTLEAIIRSGSDELLPSIVDQLSVQKGFEKALGAALGEDLDAPLDGGAKVHWAGASVSDSDPDLPAQLVSLSQKVTAPKQLARRLSQIAIVDVSDALKFVSQLKVGQRLVSVEGDLWRWDGYFASADAPTAAAQKLAQKNRLTELNDEMVTAQEVLAKAQQLQAKAEETLQTQQALLVGSRAKIGELQRAIASANDAALEAERNASQLQARKSALDSTVLRFDAERDGLSEQLAVAKSNAEQSEDLSALEADLAQVEAKVQVERSNLSQARVNRDSLVREFEMNANRLAQIETDKKAWLKRIENAEVQKESLFARVQEGRSQLHNLDERPGEIEEKRRALASKITDAEAIRSEKADALAQAETKLREADRALKNVQDELSQLRENRVRNEERLASAKTKVADIEARILQEVEVQPHQLHAKTGLALDDAMPELALVERKLEKLRADRERLGAVNLRAEAEQSEIFERHENLLSEQKELLEAIAKLRGVIGALNRQGRERLLTAFDEVNKQFERLFEHLFGGGTAELQLIESDDPLEAGLEILARPPGKKPQTMTLLSGGEQALTAMALIFAVFLTNPAPICVLDEVDAPLDDHNVERYCNLLDEMVNSTKTRFVIITHNPITMARMDQLFGVTMAERGVSQIVSVNLTQAEEMVELS